MTTMKQRASPEAPCTFDDARVFQRREELRFAEPGAASEPLADDEQPVVDPVLVEVDGPGRALRG